MGRHQFQASCVASDPTAMSGHQGGATSALSRKLATVAQQLRTGKTRKSKDLDKIADDPNKRGKIEKEKAAILAKMAEAKDKRHDERMTAIKEHTTSIGEKTTNDVNVHTTAEANRFKEEIL